MSPWKITLLILAPLLVAALGAVFAMVNGARSQMLNELRGRGILEEYWNRRLGPVSMRRTLQAYLHLVRTETDPAEKRRLEHYWRQWRITSLLFDLFFASFMMVGFVFTLVRLPAAAVLFVPIFLFLLFSAISMHWRL